MVETIGVGGQYKLLVLDHSGKLEHETEWQNNMLLDSFFQKMTTSPDSFGYHTVKVGRSNIAVNPTQTALQDYISIPDPSNTATSNPDITTNGTVWSGFWEATYTFPIGAITGAVREVGWLRGSASGAFVDSRVVLDQEIVLDSTQQLVVKFKLSISGSDIPREGTCEIDGQTYSWYACRADEKNSLDWILSYNFSYFVRLTDRVTGFLPIGQGMAAAQNEISTYGFVTAGVPAGTVRSRLFASISQANMQIDAIFINYRVKMLLTPPLIKTNEMTLEMLFDTVYTRA